MDSITTQCASQSVGPANQVFSLLIQTILAAQCSISPPDLWPEDYGEKFNEESTLQHSNIWNLRLSKQRVFQCVYNKKICN